MVLRFFFCGLFTVCHDLYALPIGVIGRLYSVIVALPVIYCIMFYSLKLGAGLGGSVGCAVRLETRRSRVQPPPRLATFFRRD